MRQADHDQGWQAFSLTYRQTGVFARPPVALCDQGEETMLHVSIKRFARFCAASHADRVSMMVTTGGYDYYASLQKHIREQHWERDGIDHLATSTQALDDIAHLSASKRATYRELIQHYVAKWRLEEVEYFHVPVARIPFGELSVRVDPKVGMRYTEDPRAFPRVLYLWFAVDPPTECVRKVFYYLLGEALRDGKWTPDWRLGIWDVRRRDILDREPPPAGMADWVHDAADEYLRLKTARRP